jgi:hypothetical protein
VPSANPPFLLCDADVIIQLFIAKTIVPLRCLRDRYGVQPVVMPEVSVELETRGRPETAKRYRTANESGLIRDLDVNAIRAMRDRLPPEIAEESPSAIWNMIEDRGYEYRDHVDRGEAYTYAAANTLGLPTTSNDGNAIASLRSNDIPVPVPVLRAFDLIAFAVQCDAMSLRDAEQARSNVLDDKRERPPAPFARASFEDGISAFRPRLVDGSRPPLVECSWDVLVVLPK